MKTEILATVEQVSPSPLGEGEEETIRMTKLGQIFTADWRQRLLLAGKLWSITVGSVSSGADVLEVVGGGNGTVVDSEQPELGIGVPAGYFLIPVSARISAHGDVSNADADEAQIILFTSRTGNVVLDGTQTTYTPINCLDGGGAFPGLAFVAATEDVTTPAIGEILDMESWQSAQVSAAGADVATLRMNYEPKVPVILAGPCALQVCWGGTAAKSGIGAVVVGCVPTSWLPVV